MFRAIISPIFRSIRLCVTACVIMHPRCCWPATSWVHYTTSCKHSLVILRMSEIIAWNMLSSLELLINRYYWINLVVYIIYKALLLSHCSFRTLWIVRQILLAQKIHDSIYYVFYTLYRILHLSVLIEFFKDIL